MSCKLTNKSTKAFKDSSRDERAFESVDKQFKNLFKSVHGVEAPGSFMSSYSDKVKDMVPNPKVVALEEQMLKEFQDKHPYFKDNGMVELTSGEQIAFPGAYLTRAAEGLFSDDHLFSVRRPGEKKSRKITFKTLKNDPGIGAYISNLNSDNVGDLHKLAPSAVASMNIRHNEARAYREDITDKANKKNSTKEFFEETVRNSENLSVATKAMNREFNQVIEATNTEFEVEILDSPNKAKRGETDSAVITIYPESVAIQNSNEYREGVLAETYIHEKAHVVTVTLLDNNKEYRKNMETLFNHVKKEGILEGEYATEDIYEFVAEVISNKRVQEKLRGHKIASSELTLWEKFLSILDSALAKLIGKPQGSYIEVLDAVLGITSATIQSQQNALNGKLTEAISTLNAIDLNGNIGTADNIAELHKLAATLGVTFVQEKGFFFTNKHGNQERVSRAGLATLIAENVEKLTKPEATKILEERTTNTHYARTTTVNVNDYNTINTVEDLKTARITMATENRGAGFGIQGKKFAGVTSLLGFNNTGKASEARKNAFKMGDFMDELGKRVFTGQDVSYEVVANEVKSRARAVARAEGISEVEFNSKYRPPVDELIAYNDLKLSLEQRKQEIMDDYGIVAFHSDIVAWSNEYREAGEIDILGEKADGSLTVIELKTRSKGLEEYDASEATTRYFNDKSKHTMQTNTYSNYLETMGFVVNEPLVVLAKPEANKKDPNGEILPVDNAQFEEIQPGELTAVIQLERRKGNVVNYHTGLQGSVNPHLKQISDSMEAAREARKAAREAEEADPTANAITDIQREAMQDRMRLAMEALMQYKDTLSKRGEKTMHIDELNAAITALKNMHRASLDSWVMDQQIIASAKFFSFAANELADLQKELESPRITLKQQQELYLKIKEYKGIYREAASLYKEFQFFKHTLSVSELNEYQDLEEQFKTLSAVNDAMAPVLDNTLKNILVEMVTSNYLGSNGEIKANNELHKEAEKLFPNDKDKRDNYINKTKRSQAYQDKIRKDARKEIEILMHNPSNDISGGEYMLLADDLINNDFVKVFHKMLSNAEQRFSDIANEELIDLATAESDLHLSQAEQEELIVWNSKGEGFLLGTHKIEFYDKVMELQDAIKAAQIEKSQATTPQEVLAANKKIAEAVSAKTAWEKDNVIGTTNKRPADKWKQDTSHLNERQQKALERFQKIQLLNNARLANNSLMEDLHMVDVGYFRLPGVLRTEFGHIAHGNLFSTVKKKWNDMTQIEKDDTEDGIRTNATKKERVSSIGLSGDAAYEVPIYYRQRLAKDEQSTDLFTIYGLELQNGIRFEIDNSMQMDATIMIDAVKGAKFYRTEGVLGLKGKSKYNKSDTADFDTMDGIESNTLKAIEKMAKSRVFSIKQEYAGHLGEYDLNRIIGTISGYTAMASMAFRGLSAANNWITGQVQVSIEAAGAEFFSAKEIATAKLVYYKNIGGIMGDMGSAVKTNYVNQLLNKLDILGDRDILQGEFERKNFITKNLRTSNALATYSMGEHEIHATLMLSVLEGQKIINKEGKFLNKEGKVVATRAEAASLLDAFSKNEEGMVQLADWAEYTEFEPNNRLSEDGLATIRNLIKERVTKTQGAFDSRMYAQLNRLWYGKLFVQFKKHLVPMLVNRWRGMSKALVDTKDISDQDKYFNYNAKTEEYGYYTSFVRFIVNNIKLNKANILAYMNPGENTWMEMTPHERANIRKSLAELSYVATTMILAGLAGAAASGDDDDDELLWSLTYLLKRQVGEGGSDYLIPISNWRVLESPMAALGKLTNIGKAIAQLTDPTELYESGDFSGENKLLILTKRALAIQGIEDQIKSGYAQKIYTNMASK